MKHYCSIGTLILAALACLLHAQGPDNPPVTDCNCPVYVSVIPAGPEKDGIIKLKPTKEGMITITVTATPPPQGAIVPTFRLRQENGKEVATTSAWTHTFNLSTLGLKFPLVLETLVDCPNFSTDGKKICDTKKFSIGGCASGDCGSGTCQSGVGQPSGDVDPADSNPFQFELGIGSSSQGDETTGLHFDVSPNNPISIGDFKVHSNGGFSQSGNVITTGTTETTIANGGGGVTVQIKKAGTNDVFRTYQFNSVTTGGTQTLTLVETRCDQQAIVHTWSLTNGVFSFSTANGLRTVTKTIEQDANFVRIERHKTYELVSGQDVLVADERLHYQTFPWGLRLVQRDIDPDTANLTTTWTYGDPSDGYGYGKLKSITRYDGSSETHTYGLDFHQVDSSGNHQEKTTWSSGTTTYETSTNGIIHAKTVEIISGNTITLRRYTSDSQYLETTTTHVAAGNDFGNQPASVSHPDGTTTSYTYNRTGGNRITTVSSGKFTSGALTDGTTSITTENAQGQSIESITTDVPSQIVIAHTKALVLDGFGRPTTIGHFPNAQNVPVYGESRNYTCCKLTSQTDIHGVTTDYQYDLLGRQTIAESLGVTRQTVYKGLTTTSHRYSVGQSATTANRVAETVSNLSGTIEENWQPDPSSATAGALVKTTTTTTYRPSTGLSRRVVTTMPDNHTQVSDYLIDGRMYETYTQTLVDITTKRSPHIIYAFTPTADGMISARAFVDNGTHREIVGTQADWAGRTLASGRLASLGSTTLTATTTTSHTYQPGTGYHLSTTDPDGVINRFTYNDRGEREISVLELNNNTTTNYGIDQVTRNRTFVTTRTTAPTVPVIRTETHVWQDNAAVGSPTLASYSERTPDGLSSWSWQIGSGVSTTTATVGLNRTITTIAPDGTQQVQQYIDGRMTSSSFKDSSAVTLYTSSVAYDSLNRPETQTDSRTGTTTTAYRSATADVPASITDPGNRTTTFTYDNRGRRTHVDAPNTFDPAGAPGNTNLTNLTVTAYNPDGTTASVTGAQNYPVSYTYDYAQRMKTMTTTSASGNVITAWNYSSTTGELISKRYNSNLLGTSGNGPDYEYTNAGRLFKRYWARPISTTNPTRVTTTYGYTGGRLSSISYNDDTPDITYFRDNLGRPREIYRGGVYDYSYHYDQATLRLAFEQQYVNSFHRNLYRNYDSIGRPISLNLTTTANVTQYTTGYSYDNVGRLQNVWHHPTLASGVPQGTATFTYGYTYTQPTPSDLRTGATSGANLKQDSMPYTVTRNASTVLTANRTYEATRDALRSIENKAGTTVISSYTYSVNPITQRESVTTAGSAFAGTQANWAWQYDALGQVIRADHSTTAASDRVYQYDSIGNRTKTASGTLILPASNNWTSNALNQYTIANGVALPTTPAPAPFDLDGNMTAGPIPGSNGNSPGVQAPANATAIKWDAENRLVSFKIGSTTYNYQYDHLSRLITRLTGSTVNSRYFYDGWNRIAEFNSTTLLDTFTWGLDLSGTTQGAGGVGGLLATRWVSSSNTDYFITYDGNGNVSEYLATNGSITAHYEYDPFGTLTRRTGSTSTRLQYRFSTKPRDVISGLYYYGYRWYDPLTGRWPSRDPIEEMGGINLYGFVGNDGISIYDLLGNRPFKTYEEAKKAMLDTLKKKQADSIKKGTEQLLKAYGNTWDKANKNSADTDSRVIRTYNPKKPADTKQYLLIFIAGQEFGGDLYCYDDEKSNKWYDFTELSGVIKEENNLGSVDYGNDKDAYLNYYSNRSYVPESNRNAKNIKLLLTAHTHPRVWHLTIDGTELQDPQEQRSAYEPSQPDKRAIFLLRVTNENLEAIVIAPDGTEVQY